MKIIKKFSSNSYESAETRYNSYNLIYPIIDNNYNNKNINEKNNFINTDPSFNVLFNNFSLIKFTKKFL